MNRKTSQIRIQKHKKVDYSFGVWDTALEDLLKAPISRDLRQKPVKWRPRSAFITYNNNAMKMFGETPQKNGISFKDIKEQEKPDFRSREAMIHNMISAPLSPRKKPSVPFTKRLGHFHDRHTTEKVFNEMAQKIPFDGAPQKKTEKKALVRGFSIPITPGVVRQSRFK